MPSHRQQVSDVRRPPVGEPTPRQHTPRQPEPAINERHTSHAIYDEVDQTGLCAAPSRSRPRSRTRRQNFTYQVYYYLTDYTSSTGTVHGIVRQKGKHDPSVLYCKKGKPGKFRHRNLSDTRFPNEQSRWALLCTAAEESDEDRELYKLIQDTIKDTKAPEDFYGNLNKRMLDGNREHPSPTDLHRASLECKAKRQQRLRRVEPESAHAEKPGPSEADMAIPGLIDSFVSQGRNRRATSAQPKWTLPQPAKTGSRDRTRKGSRDRTITPNSFRRKQAETALEDEDTSVTPRASRANSIAPPPSVDHASNARLLSPPGLTGRHETKETMARRPAGTEPAGPLGSSLAHRQKKRGV